MDDVKKPRDGFGVTARLDDVRDPRFVPMKLVLQPSGLAVELTKSEMVLGRHLDVDLRLPLPDVSRRHCRFVFTDRTWQVYDLNSLNGTFVNQRRVQHAILRHGDTMRLGSFNFQVEIESSGNTIPLPTTTSSERVLRSIAEALQTQSHPNESKRQAS